ncbi:DUF4124 domain-containing protein [Marinicella sediminis]|uniref:DUF4124 domain-containing protein n=1 Tax=Marinicella sediminis TaxID=1792834 RepID=A0ABV7JH36_9GAMM|nr:DUF4124 domain-containing protein [Marinicella sediminis]
MRNSVLLMIVISAFSATSASAQVYKWVDEHGVTHYSQTKPAADAQEIKVKGMKSEKDRDSYANSNVVTYGTTSPSTIDVDCEKAVRNSSQLMVEELKASSSGNNNPFVDVLTDPKFIIDTIAECNREVQDPAKAAIWLCQQNATTAKAVELCER